MCGTRIPTRYLSEEDIPDQYKGFVFRTDQFTVDSAVFDDGWQRTAGSYGSAQTWNWMPTRQHATVTLPSVGEYTDPQGDVRPVTATISVEDSNGGFVSAANPNNRIVALGGTRSHSDEIMQYAWKPADTSKRTGIDVTIRFTYADTGESVGEDFHGATGIADIDGNNAQAYDAEGIEFVSGFDALYLSGRDADLQEFGENGVYGTTNNESQFNWSTEEGQKHLAGAVFTGDTIRIRYSQGYAKNTWNVSFREPLFAEQLRYDVAGKAVDEQGATLKTWTVAQGLAEDGTYTANAPTINGYRLVGVKDGSYPESGSIAKTDADRTVVYEYRKLYVLSYDENGGNGTMSSMTEGNDGSVTVASNGFSRDGHSFAGWNTTPDGTGTKYDPDNVVHLNSNMTLYAQWTPIPVTITYNANNEHATGSTAGSTVNWGDNATIAPNGYALADYAFTGWNTQPDGTGTTYQPGDQINPTDNMILYAQWKQLSLSMPNTGSTPWLTILLTAGIIMMVLAGAIMLKQR